MFQENKVDNKELMPNDPQELVGEELIEMKLHRLLKSLEDALNICRVSCRLHYPSVATSAMITKHETMPHHLYVADRFTRKHLPPSAALCSSLICCLHFFREMLFV